VLATRGKVAGR